MATFHDLQFKETFPGTQQALIHFPNGYGASVITGDFAYAGKGEYELAVIKKYDDNRWMLCNTKLLRGEVVGYRSPEQITELLNKIEKLA